MTPTLRLTELAPVRDGRELLVVGPSIGTAVAHLWRRTADALGDRFGVLGWDLPGHGSSAAYADPFTVGDLATAVVGAVDAAVGPRRWAAAGVSVGGCVTQQLLLDQPDRVTSGVVLASAARIGEAGAWAERAAAVRRSGTSLLVAQSAQRWFAPGFADRDPETVGVLLQDLHTADADSYAGVCGALGAFDVRDRLGEIAQPLVAIAGAADTVTPPAAAHQIASGVRHGRAVVIDDAAHLPPAEQPQRVADLIAAHLEEPPS